MQIHEFVDEGLGHSSYVIDLGDGTGALVDPPRFPTAHEQLADRLGLTVAWTIDTHSHADYVTGSPGLAARRGATFVAPAASRLATPHRASGRRRRARAGAGGVADRDGDTGHTPDHHAYMLAEHGAPVALFSGGSLMVGTVGRTDLCGPEFAVPLAHEMFRASAPLRHAARRRSPSTRRTAPGRSAPPPADRSAPRRSARNARPTRCSRSSTRTRFVERLVAGFGTFPTYFARLPELNRLGPIRYDPLPTLAALSTGRRRTAPRCRRGRGRRPPCRRVRRRPRARFAVEHAATGVRQLARLARRRRPAAACSSSTATRIAPTWCASASTSATSTSSASSPAASTRGLRTGRSVDCDPAGRRRRA